MSIEKYTTAESFKKYGLIVIENVLSKSEVESARALIIRKVRLMNDAQRFISIREFCEDSELLNFLIKIQFNKKITSKLKEVIGENLHYVNDVDLQCNMFGVSGKASGYHRDCGSEQGYTQNKYLFSKDYCLGKVGLYLQDNTYELGGGIDLITKSQKDFKFFKGNSLFQLGYLNLIQKVRFFILKFTGNNKLFPIKAGSAVFFDSRLIHRSSPPHSIRLNEKECNAGRVDFETLPENYSKFALYWQAGSKKNCHEYLTNIMKRAVVEEFIGDGRKLNELLFTEILSYSFPDDYPNEYKKQARLNNLNIYSFPKQNSSIWKLAFQLYKK